MKTHVEVKQQPSSDFSVLGLIVVPPRTRSALGCCCGSRRGSWCRSEGLGGEWWEKGARPVEAGLSAVEGGDRTLSRSAEGPQGEGSYLWEGSWGGSQAVGLGNALGPCVQPTAAWDTH